MQIAKNIQILALFTTIFFIVVQPLFPNSNRQKLDSILKIIEKDRNLNLSNLPDIVEKGIQLSLELNDYESKCKFHYYLGSYYHQTGNYSASYNNLLQALKLSEKYKLKELYPEILRFLGESNRATANFDLALEYLDKSITEYSSLNNQEMIARCYNRKSAVFFEYKVIDSMIYYANLSNKIMSDIDSNSLTLASNYNILAVFYIANNIDLALHYFNKSKEIYDRYEYNPDKAITLINLARLYLTKNEPDSALAIANQAYELSNKYNVAQYIINSSQILNQIYQYKRDYENAYKYLSKYEELKDSIIGYKTSQQITNIQNQYLNEGKEKELNHEQDLNFYKITILVIIIIIVLLFATVFYFKQDEQFKKNKELEQKNALINSQAIELKELNINKDLLFSIVAHDLKNPISTMQLIATMLRDNFNSLPEEEKIDFINDLIISTEAAQKLLENLLLWSRSQRNLINVFYERSNPFEITSNVISILLPSAKSKNIRVINKIPKDFEFVTDANMFSTIIRNLVTNAIKFTPGGGRVIIECNCDTPGAFVEFNISDTGVGMTEEEIARLFQPGRRLVGVGTNNEKGTGLGLLICKDFCSKMDGYINVISSKDEGSKFVIVLPFKKETEYY